MVPIIGSSYLGNGFAPFVTHDNFSALVRRQFWPTARLYPLALRSCPALAGSRSDEFAFEFGKPAEHREHEPAVWRCRVCPGITKRTEPSSLLGNGV